MKIVIVGVGVMGAATARSLAQPGHEVTMLEQFRVGTHGSSHGTSRYRQLAAYPSIDLLEPRVPTIAGFTVVAPSMTAPSVSRSGHRVVRLLLLIPDAS